MRIGLLLPAVFGLTGPGNGIWVQAEQQAAALEALGHDVLRLNAWTPFTGSRLDILHGYFGAFPLYNFDCIGRSIADRVGLAPIIDTNQSNRAYRLAAALGRRIPKIFTIPGELCRQAHGCDVVACRSEHERRRMIDGLGVPAGKAKIVLNGTGPAPQPNPEAVRELLGFDGDFVLHLSQYQHPRKNVMRLIEAVGPTKIPLVIAGTEHENETMNRIRSLSAQYPSVRRLGFLSVPQRDALLAGCRVLAMPSIHEGTGLAALEAASAGAAVVITKNGGARDYFQNHAAYVDPYDTAAIQEAVVQAFSQPRSCVLAEHVRQNLTWRRSAEALLDAYKRD